MGWARWGGPGAAACPDLPLPCRTLPALLGSVRSFRTLPGPSLPGPSLPIRTRPDPSLPFQTLPALPALPARLGSQLVHPSPVGTAAAGTSDTHHILWAGPFGRDLDPLDAQTLGTVVFGFQDVGAAQLHRVALGQVQHLPALAVDPDGQEESWGESGTRQAGWGARGHLHPPTPRLNASRPHVLQRPTHGEQGRGRGSRWGCVP